MLIDIICILVTLWWIYVFFIKKRRYTLLTYIWAGIYFPLFLYQLNWSSLIDTRNSFYFNYIFVVLAVLLIFYEVITSLREPAIMNKNEKIILTGKGKFIIPFINIIFIFLYLLENYAGSKSIAPALKHIDIHTYYLPIISYFTNCQYLVLVSDYYYFKATKNKKYLLLILIVFFMPMVTRSSRMQSVLNIVSLFSTILFFEGAKYSLKNYKKVKKILIVLFIVIIILLNNYTNYRMSHYGKYQNISYLDEIKFTGPKELSFLAIYYGYFPMSFNNLKLNLLGREVEHNYIGLYSFACLYFGIFQLDNLLGMSPYGASINKLTTAGVATVPTGFWEFYYDYGLFLFIPIIVSFYVCGKFLKKSIKEKNKLTYRTLYFWYVPLWFFMSFQNVAFSSTLIIVGIFIYLVIKNSFDVREENKEI